MARNPQLFDPPHSRKTNKEVQIILSVGVIELSHSAWAGSFELVKMKGLQTRNCCTFSNVNVQTRKKTYSGSTVQRVRVAFRKR